MAHKQGPGKALHMITRVQCSLPALHHHCMASAQSGHRPGRTMGRTTPLPLKEGPHIHKARRPGTSHRWPCDRRPLAVRNTCARVTWRGRCQLALRSRKSSQLSTAITHLPHRDMPQHGWMARRDATGPFNCSHTRDAFALSLATPYLASQRKSLPAPQALPTEAARRHGCTCVHAHASSIHDSHTGCRGHPRAAQQRMTTAAVSSALPACALRPTTAATTAATTALRLRVCGCAAIRGRGWRAARRLLLVHLHRTAPRRRRACVHACMGASLLAHPVTPSPPAARKGALIALTGAHPPTHPALACTGPAACAPPRPGICNSACICILLASSAFPQACHAARTCRYASESATICGRMSMTRRSCTSYQMSSTRRCTCTRYAPCVGDLPSCTCTPRHSTASIQPFSTHGALGARAEWHACGHLWPLPSLCSIGSTEPQTPLHLIYACMHGVKTPHPSEVRGQPI